MSQSVNKCQILGYLGADPQITNFEEGGRVANLSVATTESWTEKGSDERKEKTTWHKVAIFSEPLIALAEKALHKGSKLYLDGSMQTRKYEKDGVTHHVTEIVIRPFNGSLTLLDAPKSAPEPTRSAPRGNRRSAPSTGPRAA